MKRYSWVLAISMITAVACGGETEPPEPELDASLATDLPPSVDTKLAHDSALPAHDSALPAPDATMPAPDAGGVELNAGWIGGACLDATDCSNANLVNPICETSSSGFPNGFCTQVCDGKFCPDTEYDGTLATTSRCIDAAGEPRCVSECDFEKSPTGCRPGYDCVELPRYDEPTTTFPVCLPAGSIAWPGIPTPPLDGKAVGASCIEHAECAEGSCLKIQGGLCTRRDCDRLGCPAGSTCHQVWTESQNVWACFKTCSSSAACRIDDGYSCRTDWSVCWPPATPPWNSQVGPADCLSAWGVAGNALSRCDTQKDDYVVVRKSARNLAVCHAGQHVKSYHVGLGFSPLGDKVQSGDGKTPEGVFYISNMVPGTKFYKAFLISYPDKQDATRALADGLITASQKTSIDTAQDNCGAPPYNTGLGGLIEIHGLAGGFDWTVGCVALDNAEVDELELVIAPSDTVVILP